MSIKSLLITAVLATAILCFGGVVKAEVADNSALIAQLQAQIAQLLAQIQTLQAQQGGQGQAWCNTFTRNLGFAQSGTKDVAALHYALLQKEGFSYSPDDENTYDEATAAAVIQFQAKYGITQTGYVGVATRTKLNSLYGCGQDAVLSCDTLKNSISTYFGTTCGQPAYNATADVNKDGDVDASDLLTYNENSTNSVWCSARLADTTSPCTSSQPSITVTSPNGGETWAQGSTQNITWTSKGINQISLELLDVNSNRLCYLNNSLPIPASAGKFNFSVTTCQNSSSQIINIPTGNYKVRAISFWPEGGEAGYLDLSDNYFVITSSGVNSCDTLKNSISTYFGTTCGQPAYNATADVNKDGDVDASDLLTYNPHSTDSAWCSARLADTTSPCTSNGWVPQTISSLSPSSGPAGTTVTVYGSGFTSAEQVAINAPGYAQSVSAIFISSSKFTFVVPASGIGPGAYSISAVIPGGGSAPATFTVTSSSNQCAYLYWFDNSNTTCLSQKQFCGSYMYQGLQTFGDLLSCQFAVLQKQLNQLSATITVTSPNGGETLMPGQQFPIKWTGTNISTVFADLVPADSSGNGIGTLGIIGSVTSGNVIYWDGKTVYTDLHNGTPIIVPPGNYKIHLVGNVANALGQTVNDMSDNYFTIATPTTTLTCDSLKYSQAFYFNNCLSSGFYNVCFNKNSGAYQGCENNTVNGCTVNNTNAAVNILCPVGQTHPSIIASSGEGGRISPSGTIGVQLGASQTFTFTPNSGYKVNNVTIDNSVSAPVSSSYTFTNITDSHIIGVGFSPIQITQPSVAVTSPNGGETAIQGTTQPVSWTASGLGSSVIITVDLYKNGSLVKHIGDLQGETSGSGSFSLPVSTDLPSGSDYKVRVTSLNTPSTYDESDNYFTIIAPTSAYTQCVNQKCVMVNGKGTNECGVDSDCVRTPQPSVTVTSPNGGETWQTGSYQDVRWTATASQAMPSTSASLYKSGVFVNTLSLASGGGGGCTGQYGPCSGFFQIQVPSSLTAGSDYKVRLTSSANSSIYDESDANFSITSGAVSLSASQSNLASISDALKILAQKVQALIGVN